MKSYTILRRACVGWVLATALFFAISVGVAIAADDKPNIVLIYADDLGYGDLSCYGATKIRTPRIDSLARDGKKFTDAHAASAVCTPSRYGLLTGQYAWRIGSWGPIFLKVPLIVNTGRTTVASLLKTRASQCPNRTSREWRSSKAMFTFPILGSIRSRNGG